MPGVLEGQGRAKVAVGHGGGKEIGSHTHTYTSIASLIQHLPSLARCQALSIHPHPDPVPCPNTQGP